MLVGHPKENAEGRVGKGIYATLCAHFVWSEKYLEDIKMKRTINGKLGAGIVFVLTLVIVLGVGSLSAQAASPIVFGCDNFEAAVREIDGVPDTGPIYPINVAGITSLNLYNRSISSLAGIEHFTGLIHLEAPRNQLTSVDVSNNDLLESLNLFHNQLTSIDVSNNRALRWLYLSYDNQLTSVDVRNNPALEVLMVSFLRLTTLDISNNPNLQILRAERNQLTTLDVSNNTQLYSIWLRWNYMASMDAVVGFANTRVDVDGVHSWGDPTFQFYPQNVENVADDTTRTSDDLAVIRDGAGTANITLPNGRTITISNIGTNLPATIDINIEVFSRPNASTAYGAQIPANSIVIDPAATGNFGFTLSITISDSELEERSLSADTVNLFHVSTAGAVSNRSNQLTRNSDNSVTVSFDSASVLVLSNNAPVAPVAPHVVETDVWYPTPIVQETAPIAHDVPQTGITGRMILPLVLALFGVAVITGGQIHRMRKKKAKNK